MSHLTSFVLVVEDLRNSHVIEGNKVLYKLRRIFADQRMQNFSETFFYQICKKNFDIPQSEHLKDLPEYEKSQIKLKSSYEFKFSKYVGTFQPCFSFSEFLDFIPKKISNNLYHCGVILFHLTQLFEKNKNHQTFSFSLYIHRQTLLTEKECYSIEKIINRI